MLEWKITDMPLFEITAAYHGTVFIVFTSYGGGYTVNVHNVDGRRYSLGYSFKSLAAAKGQATKHAKRIGA